VELRCKKVDCLLLKRQYTSLGNELAIKSKRSTSAVITQGAVKTPLTTLRHMQIRKRAVYFTHIPVYITYEFVSGGMTVSFNLRAKYLSKQRQFPINKLQPDGQNVRTDSMWTPRRNAHNQYNRLKLVITII
jgi:hypothetical protein